MCTLEEKREALLKVIAAYLERGSYIQYDQRCMDRSLMLTPRRIKLLPPEAATEQRRSYYDCSSFVGAVFYEAFGYELPADLTWHMVDEVGPRVYFYELTHNETAEDKAKIEKELRTLLEVGDVITYDRGVGSGHTMVYVGEGRFAHCTSVGPDSYDYLRKRSREYEAGGLFIAELEALLTDKRLFSERSRRIAVARPIEIVGEPTERTKARLSVARGLKISVLTSHAGKRNARHGEIIEFKVKIEEKDGVNHEVNVNLDLPDCAVLVGEAKKTVTVGGNETVIIPFSVRVDSDKIFLLSDVSFTVSGILVSAPPVLIGKRLSVSEEGLISSAAKMANGDMLSHISRAYRDIGISVPDNEKAVFSSLFYLHDAPGGDVLSRRAQKPFSDGAVYSLFGGTGVVTPEMISYPFIRANQILERDFIPGDIIVVADDALANRAYTSVYTAEAIFGEFEADGKFSALSGKAAREFIDSLMGRFAFAVLRPSLTKT